MPEGLYQILDPRVTDGQTVYCLNLPWGYVLFGAPGKNGMTIVNTMVGDPPEVRFVSPDGNSGKWSFCVGADPVTAVEHVLVQGKTDERLRGRPDLPPYGSLTIHLLSPRLDPTNPRDDGVYAKALLLHDYTWFKNLDLVNRDEPVIPELVLPPVGEEPGHPPDQPPDQPPLPPDSEDAAWLANEAKHRDELDAIAWEFINASGSGEFQPDDKTRAKYMSGENKDLKSIHDDMVQRFGSDPGPCQWKPKES